MEAYKIDLYSLNGLNKDIDIRVNLLNKTWRVFNDSDAKETCFFSEDGKLVIVKDGVETTMSWEIEGSKIKIGKYKLSPSYKDNILFAFSIPERGYVFLINEQNGLSIIPKTKQDLYDYFQRADLAYLRFSYPVNISKMPFYWYFIWLFVAIITIPLAIFFTDCKLADRILVEFGVDNNFYLSFAIIALTTFLAWLLIKELVNRYSLAKNRQYEQDLFKSQEKWIENNINNDIWKQYGYSLFNYNHHKSLRTLRRELCVSYYPIGLYDEKIETREQLRIVTSETGELRRELCKKTSKKTWMGIFILIALISLGIIYTFYQILPPSFKEMGAIMVVVFLVMLFSIIAFGIWLIMCLVVKHFEHKRDCYRIERWIKENQTDWRKEYVMFKNYSDYKEWK